MNGRHIDHSFFFWISRHIDHSNQQFFSLIFWDSFVALALGVEYKLVCNS